jgi:fumarate reductase subunit D
MFNVVDEEGDVIAQWGMAGNNEKVSGFWIFFQFAAAIVTILLLLSALLFALAWVPAKAFGKMKAIPLRTVLFPLLATLSLFASLVLPMMLSSDMIADFGKMSAVSLTIFLGTLVFAGLTLFSLYTSYRSYSTEMSGFVRVHSVLVTLACTSALLYVWNCGLIGLRTWAY